jgi:thiol-disulfide isomerase/thioredoxin
MAGAGLGIVHSRKSLHTGATAIEPAVSSLTSFKFTTYATSRPVAPLAFVDDAGHRHTLDDFRGKLVLLNVWATWCPPCREEMPTLDRLQEKMGGVDFTVVPLSIDAGDGGVGLVRQFYRQAGVTHLPIFNDSTGTAAEKMGTVVLPATLLIDRDGREIGRTVGPANWNSAEVTALIQEQLDRSLVREGK